MTRVFRLFCVLMTLTTAACDNAPGREDITVTDAHMALLTAMRSASSIAEGRSINVRGPSKLDRLLGDAARPSPESPVQAAAHEEIVRLMSELGVLAVYYSRKKRCAEAPCPDGASLYLTSRLFAAGVWYLIYDSEGYTEEYQVPNVQEAIAASDDRFLHFCEPLEKKNWFYCFNNH